ncbi:DUF4277 domain-containing protein [Nostoc sp. ChiVER01]|uniref:DUF4277 domain-containing protein n=1 Tax=unclassified Nostoc TaxID=2593658 RepID=UPI003A0FB9BA
MVAGICDEMELVEQINRLLGSHPQEIISVGQVVKARTSPFKVSVFRYYFWDRILAVETWGRLEGRVRFSILLVFFGARGWDAKRTKLTRAAKSRSMLVSSIRFICAKTFHSFGGIAIIMPR